MSTLPAPFGWPGGKRQLKARIISLIPPHKTYVEPFAGAASVFWAKPRSEEEVLNDLDVDLIRFYKALPKLEHCDIHTLGKNFPGLVAKQGQQQPCEFLAGVMCSFGGNRRSTPTGRKPCFRNAPTFHQNLPRYKERLQGVTLHNEDWVTTVARYDSPDTFFYFDPPYHDMTTPHDYRNSQNQLWRLADILPRLKGSWLLTYSDNPEIREAFRGFPMRPFQLRTSPNSKVSHLRRELIIANIPLGEPRLERPWAVERRLVMLEGSITALQGTLMAALDQAERLHAEVAKAPLRVQQTVGRQLEEVTIPMLHRLLDQEDAFGGIPTLRRTVAALESTADQGRRLGVEKTQVTNLVEKVSKTPVVPLTKQEEEAAAEDEQAFLLS